MRGTDGGGQAVPAQDCEEVQVSRSSRLEKAPLDITADSGSIVVKPPCK